MLLLALPLVALTAAPEVPGGSKPLPPSRTARSEPLPEVKDDESDSTSAQGENTGEEGFLDPYYAEDEEEARSEGGCFDGSGGDLPWMALRLIFSVPVSHHADPFGNDLVRHSIGTDGAPFGLDVSGGLTNAGGLKGAVASARIWTPSPVFLGAHYDNLRIRGHDDFWLLYPEVGVELLYDLPVDLSPIGCGLVARQEDEDVLWGGGVGLDARVRLLDFLDLSADYRLAWLSRRPLHRWSSTLAWNAGSFAAWGGYLVLRNCEGETEHGPAAGLRIRI